MRQKDFPKLRDYRKQWMIGDNIWRVKFVRHIPHGVAGRICVGMAEPSEQIIYIALKQKPRERFKTFVHEMLHVLEDEYGFVLPHKLVYKLEDPIMRLIVDNFF